MNAEKRKLQLQKAEMSGSDIAKKSPYTGKREHTHTFLSLY
jgi:hypothetical protein